MLSLQLLASSCSYLALTTQTAPCYRSEASVCQEFRSLQRDIKAGIAS